MTFMKRHYAIVFAVLVLVIGCAKEVTPPDEPATPDLSPNPSKNATPVLSPIGPQNVQENQLLTFTVSATDADGSVPILRATLTNLPSGPSFTVNGNGSGTFRWTPALGSAANSPYTVIFTATDSADASKQLSQTVNIIVASAPTVPPPSQFPPTPISTVPFLQAVDGLVAIEAESYTGYLPGTNGHSWMPMTQAGASAAGVSVSMAMQALPEDTVAGVDQGFVTTSPQLQYAVNFGVSGTHYIWIRGLGANDASDSLHVGLDGAEVATGDNINSFMPFNSLVWSNTRSGTPRTINIAAAGIHTINVWMRESGMVFDKIVVTNRSTFVPTGLGPVESGRNNGLATLAAPVFTPPGGNYSDSVTVAMASATPGVTLRYTVDGSTPSATSAIYTAPLSITQDTTLRASAFNTGFNQSVAASQFYHIVNTSPDLAHYWRFEETAPPYSDSMGVSQATCINCPSDGTGLIGKGKVYDGATDEVNVSDDGSFDWATNDRVTLEVWALRSASCATTKVSIVGRHEAVGLARWWLGCQNNKASFEMRDSNGISAQLLGSSTITDGKWHHIVAIKDGFSQFNYLYVDGQLQDSKATSFSGNFVGTADVNIGWLNDSAADYHFNGIIDDLAIHHRTLSKTQISRDYMDGKVGLRLGFYAEPKQIKVMPLGDSITARPMSYRKPLWFQLVDAGYWLDFVGLFTEDPSLGTHDREHEGRSGLNPVELEAGLTNTDWLNPHMPDVVLLHIGTNGDKIAAEVSSVLDAIYAHNPAITVVLARIINESPSIPAVTTFNQQLQIMANARILAGDKIVVVDQENNSGLIYTIGAGGDMSDRQHPNDSGFAKMAPVWFDGLRQFLPASQSIKPTIVSNPVTSATAGGSYVYQVDAVGFPEASFSFTNTTTPTGMIIHPDTGLITWSPPTTGNINVTVRADNLSGFTTQSFTLVVN